MPSLKINIVKTLWQHGKCLECNYTKKSQIQNCSITIIANVKIYVLSIDKARK